MRKMWLRGVVPALTALVLTAASLAGCAGSLNDGKGAFGSNSEFASDGPFGTPKPGASRTQTASAEGFAPVPVATPVTPVSPAAGAPPVAMAQVPTRTSAAAFSAPSDQPGGHRIGVNDVLEISVFKVPELSKAVQVAETGTVNLPLVGEVPAAGRTAQQFERELAAKLGAQYLQNPQVTVIVKENNSQVVTIEGAVARPGVYPIKSQTSLLQLVAISGGLKDESDSTMLVMRTANGKRAAAKFNMSAIQSGTATDPQLQSGDVVVAGTSAIKKGFSNVLKALPIAGLFALL